MKINTFLKLVLGLFVVGITYSLFSPNFISPINADITSSLIGHWQFNQSSYNGTPGEVADSGSGGNSGTAVNGATTTSGLNGNALSLDGYGDYVEVASSNVYSGIALPVSVSAWVKTEDDGRGIIFQSHYSSTNYIGIKVDVMPGGGVNIQIGDGGSPNSGNRRNYILPAGYIKVNKWTHVVAVVRGNTDMDIYIDGVEYLGSYSGSGSGMAVTGTVTPIIGGGGDFDFNGELDDIRFYDKELLASDVSALYALYSGSVPAITDPELMGYWKFNEVSYSGAAGEVVGSSLSNYTGTTQNGVSLVSGVDGNAAKFDNIDSRVVLDRPYEVALPATVSAWVKMPTNNAGAIFDSNSIASTTHTGVIFSVNPDGSFYITYGDGTGYAPTDRRSATSPAGVIIPNRWTHITGVVRGATDADLYVDGSPVAVTYDGSGGAINSTTANLGTIGTTKDDQNPYYGMVDELRFYGGELNSTQVQAVYNLHSANVSGQSSAGLMGYWKFDEGSYNSTPGEVFDSSQSGFNGTTFGGPSIVSGQSGNAISLDGVNDEVVIGDSYEFSLPVTVVGWIKQSAYDDGTFFGSHSSSPETNYKGIWVGTKADGTVVANFGDGLNSTPGERRSAYTSAAAFPLNTWTHVAAVIRGAGDFSIYINGSEVPIQLYDGTGGALVVDELSLPEVGDHLGEDFFSGQVDELRFYATDIGSAAVSSIYNSEATAIVSQTTCPPSVQARFQIDGIGLYESGTFSQSFVNSGSPFQYSVVMNEDTNQIFGGEVTLTKPDTTTIVSTSANGVTLDNPAQIGTYTLVAKATNGDTCATASVNIIADPSNGEIIPSSDTGSVTLVSGGTDVTTTPSVQIGDVYVRDLDGDIVAKVTVDLNAGRDWGAMTVKENPALNASGVGQAAILHYPGGASSIPGIVGSSFTLYVPRLAEDDYVRICPGAKFATQLSPSCSSGINLIEGTTGQYTVAKVNLEGRDLWEIAGVTGTGGLGIQEGRTLYIDLVAEPATLPSNITAAPEVPVSTADNFYFSYIPTTTEFGIGDTVDAVIPQNWSGLATCAGTGDADGTGGNDHTVALVDDQIIRFTFTAVTTTALSTGVEFCFTATTPATVGNYSIATSDTNDGDFSAALIYVGDDNDVTVTAAVPITLSLRIKEATSTLDTNSCNLGALNPGSINQCSYRLAVGTNHSGGVDVYVLTDGDLDSGANTIDAVADDDVTTGFEEYGVNVTLGFGFSIGGSFSTTLDKPLPTTETLLVSAASTVDDSSTTTWNTITHSASVNSGTVQGGYNQVVTYRAFAGT